jgi:hypothetical protein
VRALDLSWVAALAITAMARPVMAAPPRELHIGTNGACPDDRSLAGALQRAFPETQLTSEPGSPSIDVSDLGDSFRVEVAGVDRTFADPERRCQERANTAAAFVSLTLDPPTLPKRPPPRPPHLRVRPPLVVTLQAAAMVDGAPRAAPDNSW